jgi:hypothetical protein
MTRAEVTMGKRDPGEEIDELRQRAKDGEPGVEEENLRRKWRDRAKERLRKVDESERLRKIDAGDESEPLSKQDESERLGWVGPESDR